MATAECNDKTGLQLLQSLVDYWVIAKLMKISNREDLKVPTWRSGPSRGLKMNLRGCEMIHKREEKTCLLHKMIFEINFFVFSNRGISFFP